MNLGHVHFHGRIIFYQVVFEIVAVKGAERGQLSLDTALVVRVLHTVFFVILQIGEIFLDIDEVARLLDEVESGESLTPRQQKYHDRTKTRDLALMTLLLGTGIRVSECVGLDLEDVDMRNNGIKIHRKGGAEVVVYFGEEVREALLAYMVERQKITAEDGSINALFLSLQNRRISVRSVENLVKKYAKLVTSLKHITPHKLRSTYGTSLYRETGDIYLVADVLGHKDVNTTRKHYAAIDDDRRRNAAKYVKLRDI